MTPKFMKKIFWKEAEPFAWTMLLLLKAKIHFIIILWLKLVYRSSHIHHGRLIEGGNIKKTCVLGAMFNGVIQ